MRCTLPLILLLLALASCGRPDKPAGSAGAAAPAASAPKLLLAPEDLLTVRPGRMSSGPVISGSVQPERRADLRAEVAAVVTQVLRQNGDPVKTGDVLMRLDDTAIRDTLGSAEEAARASSQALDQLERQVQRLRTLQAQGMTSTQALEDAEVRRNNSQSEVVAAKARVVSARQQLSRTLVRAPFDGVVSERKASIGDTVQVGRELLKVIDPGSMRFEGLVSADRLGELKVGQPVSFKVNGFSTREIAGKVRRIDAAANAVTRQVEVVVGFVDPATAPRVAGLFAEGRVETGSMQGLLLPETAVVRAGDAAFVWRLGGDAIAKVPVMLGERDARTGELPVLSGLAAGDRLLRTATSGLVDGQRYEMAGPVAAASAPAPAASR